MKSLLLTFCVFSHLSLFAGFEKSNPTLNDIGFSQVIFAPEQGTEAVEIKILRRTNYETVSELVYLASGRSLENLKATYGRLMDRGPCYLNIGEAMVSEVWENATISGPNIHEQRQSFISFWINDHSDPQRKEIQVYTRKISYEEANRRITESELVESMKAQDLPGTKHEMPNTSLILVERK